MRTATDYLPDYIHLIPQFLPPSLAKSLLTFTTTTFGIMKTLQNHLSPLLLRVLSQPDLTSVLLLLVLAFISFKVLDMMYRTVIFWVSLALRLTMWGAIGMTGFWIYNRGVDGFVEDVHGLVEHWTGEYQKYAGEVKRFQSQKEAQIKMQQNRRGAAGWW
jgi:hypothetical protein